MLLSMSFEIPLVIAAEVSPAAGRWLPIGGSHFRQLAILALSATFAYGVFWSAAHMAR